MEKLNLKQLKERFAKDFPEETEYLNGSEVDPEGNRFAALVWRGYKQAFVSMGMME